MKKFLISIDDLLLRARSTIWTWRAFCSKKTRSDDNNLNIRIIVLLGAGFERMGPGDGCILQIIEIFPTAKLSLKISENWIKLLTVISDAAMSIL